MDTRLGENIRRILYARLLAYPDYLRHAFTHPMSDGKQLIFSLCYPVLRNKIYQTYVVSPGKVEQSRHKFDAAMHTLAQQLEQGPYLVGDRFTRADLSVDSMLSLLVMPAEHPFPWREIPDPHTRLFYDAYRDHPVSEWVRKMYRTYRLPRGETN